MKNEAKLIRNTIKSFGTMANFKEVIVNCVLTCIAVKYQHSIGNLRGVPPSLYRMVPRGTDFSPLDTDLIINHLDIHCPSELNLILSDGRATDIQTIESLLKCADRAIMESICHEV